MLVGLISVTKPLLKRNALLVRKLSYDHKDVCRRCKKSVSVQLTAVDSHIEVMRAPMVLRFGRKFMTD